MFGNGGWMSGSWGGGMMAGSWLLHLLFLVGLVLLIVWIMRSLIGANQAAGSLTARQILDQRYASGDLTRKEYDQMKKDIASK